MGKKISDEYERFKNLLRRRVAVPKKEAEAAGNEEPEPGA